MMKYNDEYHESDESDPYLEELDDEYHSCGDKYLISPEDPRRRSFTRFMAIIGMLDLFYSIYE